MDQTCARLHLSAFFLKIGSSQRIKSLQDGFFCNSVALTGGLLRGCAQRQPRVFQGGDLKLHALARVFLLVAAKAAHFVVN